uniref:Complex III subunit 9 n=1 Tax=Labidocera rotunda TaxID=207950 RepID=A0A0U2IGJ1_9MAXI|nr:cytochrome b-c1 complex subunit 9 [Labidocera rotunda]
MGLASLVYQGITKRTSTLVFTICVGALLFERGFDATADYLWETNNKGKLWKDIKHKYETEEE